MPRKSMSISAHRHGPSAIAIPPYSNRPASPRTAAGRCATPWTASRYAMSIVCFALTTTKDDETENDGEA
jgi:hypothetical protein